MANYNKIILVGNLTRNPELRVLPGSQTSVVDFGLAVNHKYRTANGEDREEVMFIDCSAFGRGAEVINQYCQKGRPILVEGRLKLDSWDDKQTGQKRSKHKVMIDNFQLLGGRDSAGGGGGGGGSQDQSGQGDYEGGSAPPPQRAPQRPAPSRGPQSQQRSAPPPQRPAPEQPFGEEQEFKDDDIPF